VDAAMDLFSRRNDNNDKYYVTLTGHLHGDVEEVRRPVDAATLVVALQVVPDGREPRVSAVVDGQPVPERRFQPGHHLVVPVHPVDAQHGVADQEAEQQQPVDVEQPLAEGPGAQEADDLQHGALDEQRGVHVQQAGMAQVQARHQVPPLVGHHQLVGDHHEAHDAHHEHGVARVYPDTVVAHCPVCR